MSVLPVRGRDVRVPFPASRGAFRPRSCWTDLVLAFVSPLIALYLCGAYVLYFLDGLQIVAMYCVISFVLSAAAFLAFRLQDGMPQYFSVYDALEVCKAVVTAELMTCVALFSLTRLEGIPRSAPIIHALILAAGIISARVLMRTLAENRAAENEGVVPEHIIVVGSSRFYFFYIRLLQVWLPRQQRVVAVLDNDPRMVGRAIEGVRVVGSPQDLDAITDEYAVHGIEVDRVIVGGGPGVLSDADANHLRHVCNNRKIVLQFADELISLREVKTLPKRITTHTVSNRPVVLPVYFKLKYIMDSCVAAATIVAFLPLFVMVGALVFFDVGSPLLFWQQRLGLRGGNFLLYKFRTLRPPFNWRGERIPHDHRLSWIGRLLRATSLDELPQLLNVLLGDMSLIGPRPLLPEDQPTNPSLRLMVRPGITGWAQVNGRNLLTADEKERLDEWYIQNASVWLDLRIVLRTLQIICRPNEASIDGTNPRMETIRRLKNVRAEPSSLSRAKLLSQRNFR
jgi:lipopolysaccharide/colanic/teichoic acid biosynthesis glycosyltransferase